MNPRRRLLALFTGIALCSSVPCLAAPKGPRPDPIKGRLEQVDGFRVLRVWGSPTDMGFAHGFLLGDGILTTVNEDARGIPEQQRAAFDRATSSLVQFVELPDRAAAELRGILDGIKAANGKLPTIPALGRPIRLEDLILSNAGDMLRAYGCSGMTAWGEKTGKLGVVTTRNFDFPVPSRKTLEAQLILVRQPEGRRQVMTITWPGYIGAFTGVNDHGVCAFMHDGTGGTIKQPTGKQTPLALVLADLLERSEPSPALQEGASTLKSATPYPFSYMVRMVTPTVDGQKPARVFRVDKSGLSENPAGAFSCVTTNHYITPEHRPVLAANSWSLHRHKRLSDALSTTVTPESAWSGLKSVASPNQEFPTLHSLVVYPDQKKFDLAFAAWKEGQIVPAPMSAPKTLKFDKIFVAPH